MRLSPFLLLLFISPCLLVAQPSPTEVDTKLKPASADLVSVLERAGANRAELKKALADVPGEQHASMTFLIRHMPERDLTSLSADYLLRNVRVAHEARAAVPWGKTMPDALFHNDVLPYASINERRDDWREDFRDRFLPLVKDAKTPGEAAQILNRDIWKIVNVKYHARKRPKPDQSPYESMKASYASCTGLSVLLIDACRACCVPARFVGTPQWSNKPGNHSWVEVWNGEAWQYTGACEYNKAGLGKAWFAGDAAQAQRDEKMHAIYASSWKPSAGKTPFPLIWNLGVDYVPGVNVTDAYARPGDKRARRFIQIFDAKGERVVRRVRVLRDGKQVAQGVTRGPDQDSNDMLTLHLEPNTDYVLEIWNGERVQTKDQLIKKPFKTGGEKDEQLRFELQSPARLQAAP